MHYCRACTIQYGFRKRQISEGRGETIIYSTLSSYILYYKSLKPYAVAELPAVSEHLKWIAAVEHSDNVMRSAKTTAFYTLLPIAACCIVCELPEADRGLPVVTGGGGCSMIMKGKSMEQYLSVISNALRNVKWREKQGNLVAILQSKRSEEIRVSLGCSGW